MIFKNKDGEIRSGWKIVLTYLFLYLIITIINVLVGITIGIVYAMKGVNNLSAIETFFRGDVGMLISSILNNGGFILASILTWKLLDKKKIRDMGIVNITKGKKEFLLGLLMGAVSISIVCIILLLFRQVKLNNPLSKPDISMSLMTGLISFVFVGFGEEFFSRAYVMSVLKQTKNKWFIIIISSAIFSALHLFNNAIGALPLFNLFLAGILLGYMFMKSKSIWMPIGFHITWNYFQGYIWGFQVSGSSIKGMYQIEIVNNNFINGGAFGPEGGIVVTGILVVFIVIVKLYYSKKRLDDFIYDNEVRIIKYN